MSVIKSVSHFFYYFEWISPKIFGVLEDIKDEPEEDEQKPKTKKDRKKKDNKKKQQAKLKEKRLLRKLLSLDLSFRDVRHLALVSGSEDVFDKISSHLISAQQLKIDKYVNIELIFASIMKERDIKIVFQIAKMFKNTNLDEGGLADFPSLIFYINIPDVKLLEMTYVMVESKTIGHQVRQKDLIKFYDSNKPFSEDIHTFGAALMFSKKNNLDLEVSDFITAIINHRDPFIFVDNFYKIEKHGLTISKTLFCASTLSQETMTNFIDLYILAREQNIDLDFKTIVKDYALNRHLDVLIKYLIKFKNEGIEEIDYKKLFYYEELNGDIKSLLNAYIYTKSKGLKFDNLYESLTLFLTGLDLDRDKKSVNALSFVKAIDMGESKFNMDRKKIIKDFHSGINVLALFYTMSYAESHGLKINYVLAKIIDSFLN